MRAQVSPLWVVMLRPFVKIFRVLNCPGFVTASMTRQADIVDGDKPLGEYRLPAILLDGLEHIGIRVNVDLE